MIVPWMHQLLGNHWIHEHSIVLSAKMTYYRARESEMVNEIIFVIEESVEGGYEARALGHAIFTEVDTYREIKQMVHGAVLCHFEESERPKVIRLHMVKDELLPV